jgi:hypothetical protein
MKNLFCFFTLCISLTVFSQQKTFEITNKESGKVKIYEENDRVKLRTLDGKKYVGELHFTNDETLTIGNKSFKIDSIMSIKKHPKVLGTVKTVVLIAGLAIVGTSLAVASGGGNAAFLLFTVGSGVCIGAGVLEAVNTNNSHRKWSFKIIDK